VRATGSSPFRSLPERVPKLIASENVPHRAEMKGSLVAVLVVILLGVAGGAYLLLHSPSTSSTSNSTGTNQSTSSTSSAIPQIQGTPAHVTLNNVMCTSNQGACVISLVNSGGTTEATGCTINGSPGVLAPKPSSVPAGGLVNVSCAPSSGAALSIPGFHVSGSIQFSDGSSVPFTGTWK
jgi:hypothetical protein